ncbi:MAG: DNA helicase Rep [Gammaproteobacteria bacterium]|nr:DNA helicase Rep [Gammaproteobacteria bacterium]
MNPEQREAVKYIDGPLLVLAGAGSGKTRVITRKIAYLVQECGIKAAHIAALTFTNKAAREMKSRVNEQLSGTNTRGLIVSTFHNLGLNILRREYQAADLKQGFSIFDSTDVQTVIRELQRAETGSNVDDAEVISQRISRWKNDFITPEQALYGAETDQDAFFASFYIKYQRQLHAYNAVDFDDLIMKPVQLFKQHLDVLLRWRRKIHYLLVDEYQDTNASQYEMLKLIIGTESRLTAVGDDDQSIYAWRGARPENIEQLNKDYPQLRVVKLEQNYRSTGRILKAANQLIRVNPHTFEKRLWSELGYGDPIRVIECSSGEGEAERVVMELQSHKFQKSTQFKDYAILYRGNFQSRLFERYLRELGIPYVISGALSFFERSEVKDIMAYLRLLSNPDDDTAFLRIVNTPRREIGPATLEKLGKYASDRSISMLAACTEFGIRELFSERILSKLNSFANWVGATTEATERDNPVQVVRSMVEEIGYELWLFEQCKDDKKAERRMKNVTEVLDWLQRIKDKDKGESLGEMVAHMCLMDILERNNEEQDLDAVSLMTYHAAKGLEFPNVFMVGVEEELLPHSSSIMEDNIEEERRLTYVGITRAQRNLTITYAKKRNRYGESVECEPSRFLQELPEDDLEWTGGGRELDAETSKKRARDHLDMMKNMFQ